MQLDANGLALDTILEILADLETEVRDALGQEIETGPDSPLGQVLSVLSNGARLLQEAVGAAYAASYRGSATGVNLDRVGSLTGTVRLPATASRVSVDVTATAPILFAPGDVVIAVAGSPERTFENEFDLFGGPGVIAANFVSQTLGPVEAPAGTLTVIPVPVAGISAVTNPLDAELGNEVETDTAYRARQERELARPASATLDGIRVDVLDDVVDDDVVDDDGERLIQDCRVFENTLDTPNSEGMPAHSIEVVVWDGSPPAATDEAIGQAVFDSKPGGIQAFGVTATTATDGRGDTWAVSFTRATPATLVLEIHLDTGPQYTPDTQARIIAALVAFWDARQRIGEPLIRSQLYDPIWDAVQVDNEVVDITDVFAAESPNPPAASNVVLGVREIGILTAGNITIIT